MKKAVIGSGGVVESVIEADEEFTIPGKTLVAGETAERGDIWNGASFVKPTPPQPPALRWTPLQFIERFTDAEQLAIVTAAQASPALRLWYDKAMASQEIVADDVRTVAGLAALVTAGLISEQRKTQILGGT